MGYSEGVLGYGGTNLCFKNSEYINVLTKQNYNGVKSVYYNDKKRVVVIKWEDGTYTKSTCDKDDYFDVFVGFCIAFTSKHFKSKANAKRFVKRRAKRG